MMITHEVSAEELLGLFQSAWWTASRDLAGISGMLAHSDVIIGVRIDHELAGFARALTDESYLAVILDVIVAPARRGTGLGATLMDAILNHPKVSSARSIELICQPDITSFYRRWGFTENVGQSRLMRRTTEPALLS